MSELTGLTAIGYARVSTDKGQTVETQKRLIMDWAESKGVTIKAIYADEGISGATFPRPELSQAIVDIQVNQIPILVCYDQSRLTRDGFDDLPIIKKMLGKCVIRYTTLDLNPDDLGAKIMSAIKTVTDSEERKTLGKRTADGMDTRKREGKHVGRPAEFLFREDIITAPIGLYKAGRTLTMSKPELMEHAKAGHSLTYVCKTVLIKANGKHVTVATLSKALHDAGLFDEYEHRYRLATASIKGTDRHDNNKVGQ